MRAGYGWVGLSFFCHILTPMPDRFTRCLLCNSDELSPLQGYEIHYLQKCRSCGFVFCYKIPTQEELIAHYDQYLRSNEISPITIKRYEALLDTFEKYRMTNNIIDVGCGDGYFLQVAKQRGWNVFGTEFTDRAIEICSKKGISMKQGKLDADNYSGGFFDVVTSFEVIEHINNPIEDVRSFNKILRSGGAAYVTTPNFNSVSRDLLGAKWNVIEYPEHLSYYTASTIKKLFKSQGFRIVSVSTTGLSIDRLKRGMRKAEETTAVPGAGRSDESMRQNAESKVIYKVAIGGINFFLDVTRKGDSLKGMFEKERGL